MTTKIRWPNVQADYRDEAAELANQSVQALQAFLYPRHPNEQEEQRLISVALEANQEILRLMTLAGCEKVLESVEPNPALIKPSILSRSING